MGRIEAITGWVETDCTIEHDGRTYEAGGAMVTDDYIVAYLANQSEERSPAGSTIVATRYEVTDWHGNVIGRAELTGSWRQRGTCVNSYFVTIFGRDGRPAQHFNARGQGAGMIIKGRRSARDRAMYARA